MAGDIDAALTEHHFQNIFPEFLPALAPKTGDERWAARLHDWGSRSDGFGRPGASTDCNGGLLLGLALFGNAGRDLFDDALWSPHWESYATSTGTVQAAHVGARILGHDAAVLRAGMLNAISRSDSAFGRAVAVQVLVELMLTWLFDGWIGVRAARLTRDTAVEVYELLFGGDRPLDHIARDVVDDHRRQGGQTVEG